MGPSKTGVNRLSGKQCSIAGEYIIVETAHREKKIAVLTLDRAVGGTFESAGDRATQIAQCYFVAGKLLGKFIARAD